MGNIVLGAVVEGGRSVARDSVSGFSTTPASYTMSREADYQANARLRAGYTPGGGALFYVTGGGAYARLDNKFTTTNGANSFADNGKTNGWGYAVGGGAELMVTNNIGLGLEYLYTDLGSFQQTAFGVGTPVGFTAAGTQNTPISWHTVRVGVNWHFNPFYSAPVMAKY